MHVSHKPYSRKMVRLPYLQVFSFTATNMFATRASSSERLQSQLLPYQITGGGEGKQTATDDIILLTPKQR